MTLCLLWPFGLGWAHPPLSLGLLTFPILYIFNSDSDSVSLLGVGLDEETSPATGLPWAIAKAATLPYLEQTWRLSNDSLLWQFRRLS